VNVDVVAPGDAIELESACFGEALEVCESHVVEVAGLKAAEELARTHPWRRYVPSHPTVGPDVDRCGWTPSSAQVHRQRIRHPLTPWSRFQFVTAAGINRPLRAAPAE